ncbi:MAG: hypothetical protein HETSPECPRED_005540 [Heterodermia speciosa]|uniref:Conidiation-specific protein 6 n=1 Tax=Heterodermia speciosa TaxID=116794 RepID=A0A8H3ISC6_9LECA|nr:MAG: hypothetical protein HETSPECPRED_005540 [Heterodermia speciosa]
MQDTAEDISNAASGHKANLSNPNTSDASKANSKEILDSMDKPFYGDEDQNKSKNPNQVAGGLKAAINNPQTTDEGKKAAQDKLDNM